MNGECMDGFTLKTGTIQAGTTDCNGNAGGHCIKNKADAHTWCQTNDCAVVSETNDANWLANNPNSVMISVGNNTKIKSNAGWASCVKQGSGSHN